MPTIQTRTQHMREWLEVFGDRTLETQARHARVSSTDEIAFACRSSDALVSVTVGERS